jgi:prepilin-type processing-associated H-X9-DG protein
MLRNGVPNWVTNVTGPQVNSGHNMVSPYVKSKALWRSPNDSMARCDSTGTGKLTTEANPTGGIVSYVFSYRGDTVGRTYGFGLAGWDSVSASTGLSSASKSDSFAATGVGGPASTIFLIPSYISWSYWNGLMQHRNDQREYAFEELIPTWPKVLQLTNIWCDVDFMSVGAYGGNSNWGFADGHAKSMKRSQIMDRTWYTDPATAATTLKRNLIHWDERYKN